MRILYHLGSPDRRNFKLVGDKVRVEGPSAMASMFSVVRAIAATNIDRLHLYVHVQLTGWSSADLVTVAGDVDSPNISWVITNNNMPVQTMIASGIRLLHHGVARLFSAECGTYPVDVCVAYTSFSTAVMAFGISDASELHPGITTYHNGWSAKGIEHETWGSVNVNSRMGGLAAAAMCSPSLWHHFMVPSQKRHVFALSLKPNLSSAAISRVADQSFVVPNGIDMDMMDAVGAVDANRGRVVGSFAAPTASKGTVATLAIYDQLLAAGLADRAVATWQQADPLPFTGELTTGCTRAQWHQIGKDVAVSLFNSKCESLSIVAIEMMALGIVLVMPRYEWAVDMMIPFGEYPFFYDSLNEAPGLVCKALDEQDEWRPRVMAFVRSFYDSKTRNRELVDGYMRAKAPRKFTGNYVNAVKKYVRNHDVFTLAELLKAHPTPFSMNGSLVPRNRLMDIIREAGHMDDPLCTIPTFRRKT